MLAAETYLAEKTSYK